MSTSAKKQVRKPAAERKREIVEHAAAIALEFGLERVTVRAVAESLGVRPGLIGHYFPAVEAMVVAAFELAAEGEREYLVPPASAGSVIDRLAGFAAYATAKEAEPLARLWLNARNLCRFVPPLEAAVTRQEHKSETLVRALVAEGLADGSLRGVDPKVAAVQMLIAFDGVGSYANSYVPLLSAVESDGTAAAFETFVARVTELACGLPQGELSRRRG